MVLRFRVQGGEEFRVSTVDESRGMSSLVLLVSDLTNEACARPRTLRDRSSTYTQRTQYPLIKECTLKYRGLNIMI